MAALTIGRWCGSDGWILKQPCGGFPPVALEKDRCHLPSADQASSTAQSCTEQTFLFEWDSLSPTRGTTVRRCDFCPPEPRPRWGDRSRCYSWRPSSCWSCRRWTLSFRIPSMLWSRKTSTFTTSWRTWPMPSRSSNGCCGTTQMVLSYVVCSQLNNQCNSYDCTWTW